MIDVVIPVGPSDVDVVSHTLSSVKANVRGVRQIYIIIARNVTIPPIENVTQIDESTFPFTIDDVILFNIPRQRAGWYLQQLIKLYADTIPGISDPFLVLDADTRVLKPLEFQGRGKILISMGNEYHAPYFAHMKRVHHSLKKVHKRSGITHHMPIDVNGLTSLRAMVEDYHNDAFWKVFLRCVDASTAHKSGASEYEMYFNYMLNVHRDKIELRELKRVDVMTPDMIPDKSYHMAHCHWHRRRKS